MGMTKMIGLFTAVAYIQGVAAYSCKESDCDSKITGKKDPRCETCTIAILHEIGMEKYEQLFEEQDLQLLWLHQTDIDEFKENNEMEEEDAKLFTKMIQGISTQRRVRLTGLRNELNNAIGTVVRFGRVVNKKNLWVIKLDKEFQHTRRWVTIDADNLVSLRYGNGETIIYVHTWEDPRTR